MDIYSPTVIICSYPSLNPHSLTLSCQRSRTQNTSGHSTGNLVSTTSGGLNTWEILAKVLKLWKVLVRTWYSNSECFAITCHSCIHICKKKYSCGTHFWCTIEKLASHILCGVACNALISNNTTTTFQIAMSYCTFSVVILYSGLSCM